jgi:hypothetical protein
MSDLPLNIFAAVEQALQVSELDPVLSFTKFEAKDALMNYIYVAIKAGQDYPNPEGPWLSQANINYAYTHSVGDPPSDYYQTTAAFADGATVQGNIVDYIKDLTHWTREEAEGFTVGRNNTNRTIYHYNRGNSGSSGGSVNTQPPLIAGASWAAPDDDVKTFNILHPIQAGFLPAVRPGKNGKIIPHPERYSTFRIMNIEGDTIYATTNIMVQSVVDARRETFTASGAADAPSGTYGVESPRQIQVSAVLLNADNFDWKRKWERVYDEMARGSVLSRKEWRLYFLYMAEIYGGYPIAQTISTQAQGDQTPMLTFQMYVTEHYPLPKLHVVDETEGVYNYEGQSLSELLEDIAKLGLLESMSEYATDPPGSGDGTGEEDYS